jgi:hypothetical protein
MLNQTALSEPVIAGGKQNIASVKIHLLKNIPIQPPPHRKLPKTEGALPMAIETNDGVVGWSASGCHGNGNGNGPHNIALPAGVGNGGLVEYHFHKWMAYNAIFEKVPQPEAGFLTVSQEPVSA